MFSNTEFLLAGHTLSPCQQHGFFRSEKTVILNNFQHLRCIGVGGHYTFTVTVEHTREDGSLSFLDTLVIPQPDGTLATTVYRKSTHPDQYLQWDSHHAISAKYNVVITLNYRDKAVCSNLQLLQKEDNLQRVLSICKYAMWALNRLKIRKRVQSNCDNNLNDTNKNTTHQLPPTKIRYTKWSHMSLA